MIGHLKGKLLAKKPYQAVVDVNGVGYELRVPYSSSQLPGVGAEIVFTVRTHVREDALTLYGFKTGVEREVFDQLVTVKGIGPRIALTALSALHPHDIVKAVRRQEPKALVVPGIGPKTAQRIVQELSDTFEARYGSEKVEEMGLGGAAEEAVSALENMGADSKLAKKAVEAVLKRTPGSDNFEAIMKGALQWLREKKK